MQTFYQACYQFAAEHEGCHRQVEIFGRGYSRVHCFETTSHYRITLYACGAEAHHLEFERCGNLVFESIHEEGV